MQVRDVLTDLVAEQQALDDVVAPLDDETWSAPTPSPRWSVTDQVAHLTYFDHRAAQAITDPDGFQIAVKELIEASQRGDDAVDELTLGAVRSLSVTERLAAWRAGRDALAAAAASLAEDDRVAWYGPSMGAKSFLTARLMETWAHGQDVCDAVGATRPATGRLRHIAQLGVITRSWSYRNRGLEAPDTEVRVELVGPDGDTWTWGPDDATDVVRGPAEDFCLVVTQRRHLDDTALEVDGAAARDWMTKAQAFAGPATTGPRPGGAT